MLSIALSLLMAPKPDVVVFESNGLGFITNTITITRTAKPDGGMIFEEKTVQDKENTWMDTKEIGSDGSLISHSIKWTNPKGNSEWSVIPAEGGITALTISYMGEKVGRGTFHKFTAQEAGDPSLTWWTSSTPKKGEKVTTNFFIPLLGMYKTSIEYKGDDVVKVKGKNVTLHKIVKTLETRTEAWWVDDTGMPKARSVWTKDENRPHRVDTLK